MNAKRFFHPILAGLFLAASTVHAQQVQQAAPIATEQRQAFEQLIREYLLSNPQVILEAQQAQQARQEMERAERSRQALASQRKMLLEDTDSPVSGNPRGDVTVVEFFDYACGYCKRAAPALEMVKAGDANLRVVYKEFPILGPGSLAAARAALASRKQGKYEQLHRALMQAENLDEAGIKAAASSVGLDLARLEKDMHAPEIEQALQRNQELAAALEIRGTPAFVVGEQLVPGAVGADALQNMVAGERQRVRQAR